MSRKIEKTFEVAVPVERVWKAMTDPAELNQWYFPIRVTDDGEVNTEILGEERPGEVVEFVPNRKLHMRNSMSGREHFGIIPGTREMILVLESTESGTRVTMTHSGFGDGAEWDDDLANVSGGIDETVSDLILYLETGVAFPRHHQGVRCWHGFTGCRVPAGMRVRRVQKGSFAHELGLQRGDILVELGGASVFGWPEVNFFMKEHAPGEKASAAWVRGDQLLRATAELGPKLPVQPQERVAGSAS